MYVALTQVDIRILISKNQALCVAILCNDTVTIMIQ